MKKTNGTSPLLSLCMIVKNEEVYLPQCLESVSGVVDEMIIVDTGSTDRTKEIALSYGAQVYDFEWIDDFAAARNYGLERAQGKYILSLDADEELSPAARAQIRSLLPHAEAAGIYLIVRSFSSLNALAPYYDSEQVRLFRNHPYYRFENAIHEMITPSIVAQGGHLVKSHLVIHHYGYLKHVVQASESRIDRDRRLLEKMYFENPNSVYTKAKLAYIYLLEKKYPKALPLLLESVQELDAKTVDADFVHSVFVALAQTAQAVGDFKLSMECGKAGWVLNTQPSLTRSSMFYYATSNVALMLDQIEQWARDEGQSLSKSILQEQIAAFKTGLHESKAILDELQSAADMTSQAKANLAIWQEKMERVGKMLEGLAGMMEGE